MGLIEHTCPDCGDPGLINPTTARWQCGNAGCDNTDEVEVGALTVEQQLAGAVEENERLRAALRWYAIGEHLPHPDHSARAQAALRSTTGGQ